MGFILKPNVVRYSRGEQSVFALLPASGKPIASVEITRRYYNGKKQRLNGQKIVVGMISSLMKKNQVNGEPFRIKTSARSGPIPMDVWIEKAKRRAVSNAS